MVIKYGDTRQVVENHKTTGIDDCEHGVLVCLFCLVACLLPHGDSCYSLHFSHFGAVWRCFWRRISCMSSIFASKSTKRTLWLLHQVMGQSVPCFKCTMIAHLEYPCPHILFYPRSSRSDPMRGQQKAGSGSLTITRSPSSVPWVNLFDESRMIQIWVRLCPIQ